MDAGTETGGSARWFRRALLTLTLVAGALAGCGGDDAKPTPTPPGETVGATATRPGVTQASPAASPSAAPSASPTAAPSPTATLPPGAGERAAATETMIRTMNARPVSPLTREACVEGNPELRPCIELVSGEATLARGLAQFAAGDPEGGPFRTFAGRTADGRWDFWFATFQPVYVAGTLPGGVRACASAGTAVHRQPSPNSEIVGTLERGTRADASRFVLAAPGSFSGGSRGEGWYEISGTLSGWVRASDVADAGLGDCELRDAIEEPGTRG